MEREGTIVEALAERVSARIGATVVFGEPVEAEGVTVIPVAKAAFGVGGGGGSSPEGEGQGGGGGGGTSPIGFIELRDGRATYRPIVDLRPVVVAAAIAAGAAVLAALRR